VLDRPWIGCIWELPPFGHERSASVRHVLDTDRPDLDGYLADVYPDGPARPTDEHATRHGLPVRRTVARAVPHTGLTTGRLHLLDRVRREPLGGPLLGGTANVDDNRFDMPDGMRRGVALRSFDIATSTWAIWWLGDHAPHALDVPVVGRFVDGVGTFTADDTLGGRAIRVRFTWSNISATTAAWEQAFSTDSRRGRSTGR
jgi:hypothetical protein